MGPEENHTHTYICTLDIYDIPFKIVLKRTTYVCLSAYSFHFHLCGNMPINFHCYNSMSHELVTYSVCMLFMVCKEQKYKLDLHIKLLLLHYSHRIHCLFRRSERQLCKQ